MTISPYFLHGTTYFSCRTVFDPILTSITFHILHTRSVTLSQVCAWYLLSIYTKLIFNDAYNFIYNHHEYNMRNETGKEVHMNINGEYTYENRESANDVDTMKSEFFLNPMRYWMA